MINIRDSHSRRSSWVCPSPFFWFSYNERNENRKTWFKYTDSRGPDRSSNEMLSKRMELECSRDNKLLPMNKEQKSKNSTEVLLINVINSTVVKGVTWLVSIDKRPTLNKLLIMARYRYIAITDQTFLEINQKKRLKLREHYKKKWINRLKSSTNYTISKGKDTQNCS